MGQELVELGERNRAPRPWTFGLRVLARTHLELGDAAAFDATVTALADLGTDLRWVPAQAHAAQWRTAQAAAAGRFDDARVFGQELVRHGRVNRGFIAIYGSQLLHLLLEQGGIVDPADIEQRVSVQPENANLHATAAHLHLECGATEDARRHLAVLATDGFAAAADEPSSPSTLARPRRGGGGGGRHRLVRGTGRTPRALPRHARGRGALRRARRNRPLRGDARGRTRARRRCRRRVRTGAGDGRARRRLGPRAEDALLAGPRAGRPRRRAARQLALRAAEEADELGMERLQEQAAGLLART